MGRCRVGLLADPLPTGMQTVFVMAFCVGFLGGGRFVVLGFGPLLVRGPWLGLVCWLTPLPMVMQTVFVMALHVGMLLWDAL